MYEHSMIGSETMITATGRERIPLERCKKGDEIVIGFIRTAKNSTPILEHIRKLAEGKVPNLNVKLAIEVDGKENTLYDYLADKTSPCQGAHVGGSLMLLKCTVDGVKPSELMAPVYDFCEFLPRTPYVWYYQEGTAPRGEYEIAEARVSVQIPPNISIHNSGINGTYHIDIEKIVRAVQRLTRQQADGGNGNIRDMIEKAAYFIHLKLNNRDSDVNWLLAQRRMASMLVCHMRNDSTWFRSAGWLETCCNVSGLETCCNISEMMGDEAKNTAYTALLRELNGCDSIHLVPAKLPVWLYRNGVMTLSRHRPDD
jgi:hypothetical protein